MSASRRRKDLSRTPMDHATSRGLVNNITSELWSPLLQITTQEETLWFITRRKLCTRHAEIVVNKLNNSSRSRGLWPTFAYYVEVWDALLNRIAPIAIQNVSQNRWFYGVSLYMHTAKWLSHELIILLFTLSYT